MANSGGGAATAGGMEFQHSVAAWAAVHTLAEADAPPPWDLPAAATLNWIRCETEYPVDDLLVGTSLGGLAFVQAKHTVQRSPKTDSPLASALDQFVRQFVAGRARAGSGTVAGPLDAERDRLVLAVSMTSSEPIRIDLPNVLQRARTLAADRQLEDAAANEDERAILAVVQEHVRTSWRNVLGADPKPHEVMKFLRLVHVQVFDLDGGEQRAKAILRTSVLKSAAQSDLAWGQLVRMAAQFASQRSGAGRLELQRALLSAGIEPRTARSYREDIERLKEYSSATLKALSHLAQIWVGPTRIKLHRASFDALKVASQKESVVVVGEPGAGKSGELHDLVEAFTADGRDCVFLAVDRLASSSVSALRGEIGLAHDIPEILDNWIGNDPAFLIIDALDAARGDAAARMIRELMQWSAGTSGRWKTVASVRKFDLRYGVEIRQMFAGSPPTTFVDSEFNTVRHINVPQLSPEEFDQIKAQSSQLYSLIQIAPADLQALLRIPFNLRLMADLLGGGVSASELTPITTQLELLDRYWLSRVIRSDGRGDSREAMLRRACENMVSARTLRVSRVELEDRDGITGDLLSSNVLVEWQASTESQPARYILAFAHNVLFDYGTARLLFGGTTEQAAARIATDAELPIVIRPSLQFLFQRLWAMEPTRMQFWDLVFRVARDTNISEIGKTIGPSVAVETAASSRDVEILARAVESTIPQDRLAGDAVLRHLVGALLATGPSPTVVAGTRAGPWCELLERATHQLVRQVAYTVRSLLTAITEHADRLTPAQLNSAGLASRRLLEFGWSQEPRDGWLVIHALQCVCRTFRSDPLSSAALIRRALEPNHVSRFGYEELPWLAREVKRFVEFDAPLVTSLYVAAFSHEETSSDVTPMGSGRILSLTSNRKQDYGMALYELGEVFGTFLAQAPLEATQALIIVVDSYVREHHHANPDKDPARVFDFNGKVVQVRTDYSGIWDEGDTYGHDDPVKMLEAFEDYLDELADHGEAARLGPVVDLVVTKNSWAVLWRRILSAATRHPDSLRRMVEPLAWALPILIYGDTTTLAGEFVQALFPLLEVDKREKVERAILSIPTAMPQEHREAAEHTRNRLLGCLRGTGLMTDEAQKLIATLEANNEVPANEARTRFSRWSGPYTEEAYLKDQGVPTDAPANKRIREMEQSVTEFATKHLNSVPPSDEVAALLPAIQSLKDALSRAAVDGVHPKQAEHAWGALAGACTRIARTENFSCVEPIGILVKDTLLLAAQSESPEHGPGDDAQFDEHPSWGSPAPRIEAASGLILLAASEGCATPDVVEAVRRLSSDDLPAVRFQIASRLSALYRSARPVMWEVVERLARQDPSRGVLQGLIGGALQPLAGTDPTRVAALTQGIFDRVVEGPGARTVRKLCTGIFTGLFVWRAEPLCEGIVLRIAREPGSYPEEAHDVLFSLREALLHGPTEVPDPKADGVRRRALQIMLDLLRTSTSAIRSLEEKYTATPFDEWPEESKQKAKGLAHLVDGLAREVYFGSGAFDAEQRQRQDVKHAVSPESERFYREASAILDELSELAFPSATHQVLESLQHFVTVDPRGVFLRIGHVIRAGKRGNYQYEGLAADLIVKLIERYLAEYRFVLREDPDCRRVLVEVLDTFVRVGWPAASRLTYRLEEIFR